MNNKQFRHWLATWSQLTTHKQRPLIMGVLNITPDSFSDGGHFSNKKRAIERAHEMIAQGADIIDIGGESSKPGVSPVSVDDEFARVIPVIEQLRAESDICISIDTSKADIMYAAADAGASMINDIYALKQPKALEAAAKLDVPVCLMHMQGKPETMQIKPHYEQDVIEVVDIFLQKQIERCCQAGIKRENLIIDPGFGFGKTVQDNLRIVAGLNQFTRHKVPVMLGVSRKSTLGTITRQPVDKRLAGGLAIAVFAALQNVAVIRTHDVDETRQALVMIEAITQADNKEKNKTRE